jgi:diketogulonate reductase-like aldo/keto reductase
MAEYTERQPAVNQLEFHPHFRREDVRKYCQEKGIFFQVFFILQNRPKIPNLLLGIFIVGATGTKITGQSGCG